MAKVNLDNLQKFVDKKLISVQKHPETDLFIYNYTQLAQFSRIWTEETMMCRGLITDSNGLIVERPFKKFFNLSEHEAEDMPNIPNEPFNVYEKLDGSLGILYYYNNVPFIATRGSFTSDQAVEATKILRYKYFDVSFNPRWTYLFEIIYPENKIVVDYGKTRDLYLLAIIDTHTGNEFPQDFLLNLSGLAYDWKPGGPKNKFPTPKSYSYKNLDEIKELTSRGGGEDEGFVIRFESGMRAKIKYDEYVRLHRLITGVTKRKIWELLKNGEDVKPLLDRVPEEFHRWVENTEKELTNKFKETRISVIDEFRRICKELDFRDTDIALDSLRVERRSEFADKAKESKYTGLLFSLLDNKDIDQMLWKGMKPPPEKPFKDVAEDI